MMKILLRVSAFSLVLSGIFAGCKETQPEESEAKFIVIPYCRITPQPKQHPIKYSPGIACRDVDCGGHGRCIEHGATSLYDKIHKKKKVSGKGRHGRGGPVITCACDKGYTTSPHDSLTCEPTENLCTGGKIGGKFFKPSKSECEIFEEVNRTRALHNDEGRPECHFPLFYDLAWSVRARQHSKKMSLQNKLFHANPPPQGGQNVSAKAPTRVHVNLYMNGTRKLLEPHCNKSSHHCNIMNCNYSSIGVGNWPTNGPANTNTLNFSD